jgi:hypothetical protein
VTVSDRPVPGGNFAAVISYGDVTMAGIGTTTYVCNNKALAFGHPLTYRGAAAFGANNANAIAVVDDPTLAPFKMATIGGLFGKLDQDRLTAVRAKLNSAPTLRPITSHVTNADTGVNRNGRSDATMNDWVTTVAAYHLLANSDVVFDHVGQGSSVVSWTIKGKRANGNPWQLQYNNRYASTRDITFESIFGLADQLAAIDSNPFEAVTFTSVDVNATYTDAYKAYNIEGVKISRNGGPFRDRDVVVVNPGDNLRVRVSLRRYRGDLTTADLEVTVPNNVSSDSFGSLYISGSNPFADAPSANSFPQLLTALRNAPKNNELVADLEFDSFSGAKSGDTATTSLDSVVTGEFQVGVEIQQ